MRREVSQAMIYISGSRNQIQFTEEGRNRESNRSSRFRQES